MNLFEITFFRSDAEVRVQGEHAACVKKTAVEGMVKTKFVERAAAVEAVERVFAKCYRDLEPIGRRARTAEDLKLAHEERYMAGYT